MQTHNFLILQLAILAATNEQHQKRYIRKCCGREVLLTEDGQWCDREEWQEPSRVMSGPFDGKWVPRWLPPGLLLKDIHYISTKMFNLKFKAFGLHNGYTVVRVNSSSMWDSSLTVNEELWRQQVVFIDEQWNGMNMITRPRPGGGARRIYDYCVDAAPPPLGPFALLVHSPCTNVECAHKCCDRGEVLEKIGHSLFCRRHSQGSWLPRNSFNKIVFDAEFPFEHRYTRCHLDSLRRVPNVSKERFSQLARYYHHDFLFSSWRTCNDFLLNNGTLEEALFYCEQPRVARGIYWLLRPLSFISVFLLAVALLSIACDSRMRRKVHGWALGCHALCLFAFNLGQVVYYLTISDVVERDGYSFHYTCKNLAIFMYFLLMAGWSWLTAVCVNMALGFRKLQVVNPGGNWKLFLALSTFAWGLPTLLASAAALAYRRKGWRYADGSVVPEIPLWYNPTLQETRVCFDEVIHRATSPYDGYILNKIGSALYYFTPVCVLVMSNVVCLGLTLRKVQFLRRGNSVLHKDEDAGAHTRAHTHATADAKALRLYMKLMLLSGLVETMSEIVAWSTIRKPIYRNDAASYIIRRDTGLPYKAAGFVTDFFRAACVAWLAAPEGGYKEAVQKCLQRRGAGRRAGGERTGSGRGAGWARAGSGSGERTRNGRGAAGGRFSVEGGPGRAGESESGREPAGRARGVGGEAAGRG